MCLLYKPSLGTLWAWASGLQGNSSSCSTQGGRNSKIICWTASHTCFSPALQTMKGRPECPRCATDLLLAPLLTPLCPRGVGPCAFSARIGSLRTPIHRHSLLSPCSILLHQIMFAASDCCRRAGLKDELP